jgi:ParB family transcriptional regulator, chromosome partitioning protein
VNTLALEERLSDALGLSVHVDHKEPGGTVHIQYRNLEQFDEIVRRMEAARK